MTLPLDFNDYCRFCGSMLPENRVWSKVYCTPDCCQRHARSLLSEALRAERMNMVCVCCGTAYTGKRSDQKYCSHRCRRRAVSAAYNARKREATKEIRAAAKEERERIAAERRLQKTRTCPAFETTFLSRYGNIHCSISCGQVARQARERVDNEAKRRRKSERVCPTCQQVFHRPRRPKTVCCSHKCAALHRRAKNSKQAIQRTAFTCDRAG